jgi:hypothetical protein
VVIVGGLIVVSFLARCIFFIIVLSANFTSSVYMFIVLMLTEVMMMFFIGIQFNWKYLTQGTTSSTGSKKTTVNSRSTPTGTNSET